MEAKLLCSRLTNILVQAKDRKQGSGASNIRETGQIFRGIEHQVQILLQLGLRSATTPQDPGQIRRRPKLLEYYVVKLDPEYPHPDDRRFESQLERYLPITETVTWCKTCREPVGSTCWADCLTASLDIWHGACLACLVCNGKAAYEFGNATAVCKYCKAENGGVMYRSAKTHFIFLLYVNLARLIKAKGLSIE